MPRPKGRKVTETASLPNRSRISNGTELLPHVHEQSCWARMMRDSWAEILSDKGGADFVPWSVRSTAKVTAVLDTELQFLASKIGQLHEKGEEIPPALLQLFTTLLNAHRRQCEAIGWERTSKPVDWSAYVKTEPVG